MLIATVSGKIFREAKLFRTNKGGFISFDVQTRKDYVKDPKKPYEWWKCELFSVSPDKVFELFKPGTWIMLSGCMATEEYKDKDGNDKKSTKLRIKYWNILGDREYKEDNSYAPPPETSTSTKETSQSVQNNQQVPWS